MAFTLNVTTTTRSEGGERKQIDWEALNAHVIEAAGTANKSRSIPGVISGIIDLGEQNREDAEKVFTGSAEDEAKIIKEKPATYFKDGIDRQNNKPARLQCWPQKPVQQIALTVDFPQVIVDKGQFISSSNPQPLRLLLNGEFTLSDKTRVVGRPYDIREVKHEKEGRWAFAKNHMIHKLADACGLLDKDGLFTKDRIGELLGKVAQFQFRVYMKERGSRSFFTEEVKLMGMVPEGLAIPEFDESILYGVNVHGENDEAAVKQLRANVKNTIQRANNFKGSPLEKMLLDLKLIRAGEDASEEEAPQEEKPKAEVKPVKAQVEDMQDDDIPF